MSTTNRAFIKAFRHDAAQPAGSGGAPAPTAEQAPTKRATVDSVAQSGGPVQATTEKRPLSSFIPREQPALESVIETPSDEQIDFQPGTTVASFNWPAVCRTLMQQSNIQLDNVVRLLMARAGAGHSLIGVLGLFPRIGATTTALCLASRAASRGRRVILADGNFRNPRLASLLDAVPTAGWEEAMKHTAPLADAVIHSTDDNLDLLAVGSRLVKDPQPMVGGLQAAVTAGVLRHAYDLAIMDIGAFFDPISQPVLLELVSNLGVDAVVAVAGPGPADRRDVATIVEHLDRSGCELLGIIENRSAKPQAA
jgi:Mrp family chromosome partitioning ATPase